MRDKNGNHVVKCPLAGHCATCMFCITKRVGKGERDERIVAYCSNPEAVAK